MRLFSLVLSAMLVSGLLNSTLIPLNSTSDPTPLEPRSVTFTNVTYSAGLAGVGGSFFAWGDYNNDGYQDLLSNGRRLFENNGPPDWDFTEVTSLVGISGGNHGTWADWNNDGYLDFFCAGVDKLYRNNGPPDYDFGDVTSSSGILQESHSVGAGWGDYDNDGDVDLFKIRGEDGSTGEYFPNSFWRNNGDGTFTNVTIDAGVDEYSDPKYSRGVAWADYNDDGWLDIYVSNYRQLPNYLYENNGDGTFTDVANDKGVADGPPYGEGGNLDPYNRAGHGVGSVWGDYNNDGYLDLWVTNLNHKDARTSDDSLLYRSDGPPSYSFTNVRDESGIHIKPYVAPNEGDELFVGCAWGDFNNDGFIDLFLPQIYDIDYAYSFLYMNNGDGTFTDITEEAGTRVWDTYAGCWSDYDNDGDLDLLTSGRDSGGNGDPNRVHLYRNNGPVGSWLHLDMRGDGEYSNAMAIGTRVTVTTGDGLTQTKEVEGGMGCHGHQNSFILEFGLGDYSGTADIEIRWPQNKIQFLEDVAINQTLAINDESIGDLLITDLYFDNLDPIMGEVVRIFSTVDNIGSTIINTAEVKYFYDSVDEENQIGGTQIVSGMDPGDESTTFVDWNTTGISGSHAVYVTAEVTDPPPPGMPGIMRKNLYIRLKNALPNAVLNANPTTLEKGGSVVFEGTNSTDDTNVVEYHFDYGDGNSSGWITSPTVDHIYEWGGNYTASLNVRDDDGGESTNASQVLIEVNADPWADITADHYMIYYGESATFDGSGSSDEDGTVEEYLFDFGDGENSGWIQDYEITHVYPSTGDYIASLTVRDDEGMESQNTAEIVIEVHATPTARLSVDLQTVYKNKNVTFDGSKSSDADGNIHEYYFDFGDGESSGWTGASFVEHSYSTVGEYTATLTVSDNDGDISQNTAEAVIGVVAKPVAVVQAAPMGIFKGEDVTFNGSLSFDEDGTVEYYYFDFGDGDSSGWTPISVMTHTYSDAGTYKAALHVMDDDGDENENTVEVVIEVEALPSAALTLDAQWIYKGESAVLDASKSSDEDGSIVEYYYDFGDGHSTGWITDGVINHTYKEVGTYTITLDVRDDEGYESETTAEKTIDVRSKPTAVISADRTVIYDGDSVTLDASNSTDEKGSIKAYNYDFGDGTSSGWISDSRTMHIYNTLGRYNISLTVRDDDGDQSSNIAVIVIEVRSKPRATLFVDRSRLSEGESVTFNATGSSDEDGTVEEYFFDFGDGEDSGWVLDAVVRHIYTSAGTYTAALKVMDDDKEESTNTAFASITVEIPNQRPTAYIDTIDPNPSTLGRTVTFRGHGEDPDGSIKAFKWSSSIDGDINEFETFTTSGLSVGTHMIEFMVRDNEGDWSEIVSEELVIKESNDKPVVTVITPSGDERVTGIINIAGSSQDPDGEVESVEVSIDGGSWEVADGTEFWSFKLDTIILTEGEHVISVRAYDGEDHSELVQMTIMTGEGEEHAGNTSEYYLIIFVVLVVVLLVIFLALASTSKRKKT